MSKFENRPKREMEQGKNIFFTSSVEQGKNIFFTSNEAENAPEKEKSSEPDYDARVRQTFYVTNLQKKSLALMAAHENMDISEIVRAALDAYIPKSYVTMVYIK
jgi:hypothetical protein